MIQPLIPVWESHMDERYDADRPYSQPHWWIHVDTILRIRKTEVYGEYVIETRDKNTYFTHKELWEQLPKSLETWEACNWWPTFGQAWR